jgi:hypothetical protein
MSATPRKGRAPARSETAELARRFVRQFAPSAGGTGAARAMLRDWKSICRATGIDQRWGEQVAARDAEHPNERVLSFCMGGSFRFKEDSDIWTNMICEQYEKYRTERAPIYLDGFEFRKSANDKKKYDAMLDGRRIASFGDASFEHFKDKIGAFMDVNHLDPARKRAYYARHGDDAPRLSAKWFSHNYLW